MKQLSLQFKTRNVSIVNGNIEGLLLKIILCSFGALALFYVLILASTVSNIIERRNLETRARALSGEVRNLELTYLSMSNGIDLPLSHSLGFKETQAIFTTRKALGLGSSDNIKIVQNDL